MNKLVVDFEIDVELREHVANWLLGKIRRLEYSVMFDADIYDNTWEIDVGSGKFNFFAEIVDSLCEFMVLFGGGFNVAVCSYDYRECITLTYEEAENYYLRIRRKA